jgi:hypothetical protein
LAEEAAYGKTVWFWRPLLASSRRRFAKLNRAMRAVNSPAMEARGIRLQGERGISCKPIARGMPGCFGCTCMLVCAFLSASCTRDRGCQPAPGIPCALSFFEGKLQASLGRHAPRECETLSSRHCERSEAIHRAEQRKGEPPPNWWTPVVGLNSQEVSDGEAATAVIFGRVQAAGS